MKILKEISAAYLFFAYRIRVSKGGFKFFDWQTAQSRVYFVPLYEKTEKFQTNRYKRKRLCIGNDPVESE